MLDKRKNKHQVKTSINTGRIGKKGGSTSGFSLGDLTLSEAFDQVDLQVSLLKLKGYIQDFLEAKQFTSDLLLTLKEELLFSLDQINYLNQGLAEIRCEPNLISLDACCVVCKSKISTDVVVLYVDNKKRGHICLICLEKVRQNPSYLNYSKVGSVPTLEEVGIARLTADSWMSEFTEEDYIKENIQEWLQETRNWLDESKDLKKMP